MTPLKPFLKARIKGLPYLRRVFRERAQLRAQVAQLKAEVDHLKATRQTWVPPGHYYSPIPSLEEIRQREVQIFDNIPKTIPGIDLNTEEQIGLLDEFERYYQEQPFSDRPQKTLRYFFENPMYSYSDAIFLYCMIRHAQPQRIIEVGCGYSSCVILDTNELFFQNQIRCTFIDPYPETLLALLKGGDRERIDVIPKKLQDIEINKFLELSAGDILFVDSSHASKVNSDVNYLFFEVFPRIKSGVYVHFHDVFYPFEYPKEWVHEGRSWTEAYLLRAFLQYNSAFKIVFFNTFLERFHQDRFLKEMPLCLKNPGGSIWIKKV